MDFAVPFLDTGRVVLPRTWVSDLIGAGYRCSHVGKWHVCRSAPKRRPSEPVRLRGPGLGGYGKTWKEPDFIAYRERLGLPAEVELEEELHARHPVGSPFSPVSARLAGPVEGSLPYFVAETAIGELRRLAADGDRGGGPFFLRCEFWVPTSLLGGRALLLPLRPR